MQNEVGWSLSYRLLITKRNNSRHRIQGSAWWRRALDQRGHEALNASYGWSSSCADRYKSDDGGFAGWVGNNWGERGRRRKATNKPENTRRRFILINARFSRRWITWIPLSPYAPPLPSSSSTSILFLSASYYSPSSVLPSSTFSSPLPPPSSPPSRLPSPLLSLSSIPTSVSLLSPPSCPLYGSHFPRIHSFAALLRSSLFFSPSPPNLLIYSFRFLLFSSFASCSTHPSSPSLVLLFHQKFFLSSNFLYNLLLNVPPPIPRVPHLFVPPLMFSFVVSLSFLIHFWVFHPLAMGSFSFLIWQFFEQLSPSFF